MRFIDTVIHNKLAEASAHSNYQANYAIEGISFYF